MKKKYITAAALITAVMMLCASCADAPAADQPQQTPASSVSAAPEASSTLPPPASPSAAPSVEPEKPVSEENRNILNALMHLGLDEIVLEKEMSFEELAAYMVRLLGGEEEALEEKYQHPYTGVSEESDAYVGYAYARWLFYDLKDGAFQEAVDEKSALCVLLRAMGYGDSRGRSDFSAEDPYTLSEALKICSAPSEGTFRGEDFAALIWNALSATVSGEDDIMFAELLMQKKIFNSKLYSEAQYLARGEEIPEPSPTPERPVSVETQAPVPSDNNSSNTGGGSGGGGNSGTPSVPEPQPPAPDGGTPGGENTTPDVPFG